MVLIYSTLTTLQWFPMWILRMCNKRIVRTNWTESSLVKQNSVGVVLDKGKNMDKEKNVDSCIYIILFELLKSALNNTCSLIMHLTIHWEKWSHLLFTNIIQTCLKNILCKSYGFKSPMWSAVSHSYLLWLLTVAAPSAF